MIKRYLRQLHASAGRYAVPLSYMLMLALGAQPALAQVAGGGNAGWGQQLFTTLIDNLGMFVVMAAVVIVAGLTMLGRHSIATVITVAIGALALVNYQTIANAISNGFGQ